MKKVVRMFGMACLMGVFAFCGSSCKKNEQSSSITINMPAVEESFVGEEKAYIDFADGNLMKWSEGDQVMIYSLNDDYTKSDRGVFELVQGAGTTQGQFYYDVNISNNSEFFVFYPASKVVNHEIGPRNSQTFDVPATQHYAYRQMDPTSLVMACKVNDIHSAFNMKHIFGFANIRIKGNTNKVKSVKIIDNTFNLNGNITIDLPAVNETTFGNLMTAYAACATPEALNQFIQEPGAFQTYLGQLHYMSEPADRTMTLVCPEEGVQLQTSKWTHFVFTLRPGALIKGFTVEIEYTNGNKTVEKYNHFDNTYCIMPGRLTNFGITAEDL